MRLREILSESAPISFAGPNSPILAQAVYDLIKLPMIFICRKSDGRPVYAVNRISEGAFLDVHGTTGDWLLNRLDGVAAAEDAGTVGSCVSMRTISPLGTVIT